MSDAAASSDDAAEKKGTAKKARELNGKMDDAAAKKGTAKKARKRVDAGGGSGAEIRRVLGASARMSLESRLEAHLCAGQRLLKHSDVVAVVKHALLGHQRPPFVTIRHLGLCTHVLMLAHDEPYPAGGSFAAAHAARLHTVVRAGVRLAEPYGERPAGARSIFFVKAADEGAPQAARAGADALAPAALHELLASPEAMREAGYPDCEAAAAAPAADAAADAAAAEEPPPRLFALDCEMVVVADGSSALARLSLLDEHEAVLVDALVRPALPVVDYRTKWSGLDADALKGATLDAAAARAAVRAHVRPTDVLIGHSLENDLRALGLAHARVIDTALLFAHPLGGGRKRKLAHLSSELLAQVIQREGSAAAGRTGHDSVEDARACLRLVRARLRDRAFGARRRRQFVTLCELLEAAQVPCAAPGDAARARARVLALRAASHAEAELEAAPPAARAFTWCAGAHAHADVDALLRACPDNTLVISLAPEAEAADAAGRVDAGEPRPAQARACALTLAVSVSTGGGGSVDVE